MKLHLSSDLHLEFPDNPPRRFPAQADVIVLAGDIAVGEEAARVVCDVATRDNPGAQVLFVPGNHEFYKGEWDRLNAYYRNTLEPLANAHYLQNEAVVIGDILFIGTLLWTGFDLLPEYDRRASMEAAQQIIPDFSLIEQAGDRWSPQMASACYAQAREFLQAQLARTDCSKKVVITHFPPCAEAEHREIPRNVLSNYFQANCRDLIDTYQPELWLFGHNHWNTDFTIGKTRLLSNHGGYPGEVSDYQPELLVDIRG